MPDDNLDDKPLSKGSADSSPADVKPSGEPSKTLSDVVKEVVAKHAEPSTADAKEAPASQAEKTGQESEETVAEAASDETEDSGEEKKDEPKGDEELPFHKHPRFQELIKERNDFKQQAEGAVAAVERDKNLNQYCAENGITNEEFVSAMNIAALLHKDPTKALDTLRSYVEALEVTVGNKLPSDLQKEVDDGTLSEGRAKELAQLRVKSQGLEHTGKRTEAQIAAERQNGIATAVNSWDAQKRTTDPAFAKKYPLIEKAFVALCSQKPPRTAAEGVALAEQAYNEVNTALGTLTPKPPVRKVLKTNGAASKQDTIEIKPGTSLREGLRLIAQRVVAGAKE